MSVHLNHIISSTRAGIFVHFINFYPYPSWPETQEKLNTYLLNQLIHFSAPNKSYYFPIFFPVLLSEHFSSIFWVYRECILLSFTKYKAYRIYFSFSMMFLIEFQKKKKMLTYRVMCMEKIYQSVFKTNCLFLCNVSKFQSYFIASQLVSLTLILFL